jgi:NH3-dependent NAD+ synthetase
MKAIDRRLDRLEDRLTPQGKKQFLIVVTDAVDSSTCVQILREAGHLDTTSLSCVVDLEYIPAALNAAELEQYLREHGTRPRSA